MQQLEVIGLEEVVDEHLHVALDFDFTPVHEPQAFQWQMAHVARDRFEEVRERLGVAIFIDEDPVPELFTAHRNEIAAAGVEARPVATLGHAAQLAPTVVGPAVIAADQRAARLPRVLAQHRRAAMAAGVVERADEVVVTADDDDGRAAVAPQEIAAPGRQLVHVSGVQPGALPHHAPFDGEPFGIRVATRRNVRQGREAVGRRAARTFLRDARDPLGNRRGVQRGPGHGASSAARGARVNGVKSCDAKCVGRVGLRIALPTGL